MRDARGAWLWLLLTVGAASCYEPNLATQIYKCDRGKCPDGLYCNDGLYCTVQPSECVSSGIETEGGVAVCLSSDPTKLCANGATSAKCDSMGVAKDICPKIDTFASRSCAYCCF